VREREGGWERARARTGERKGQAQYLRQERIPEPQWAETNAQVSSDCKQRMKSTSGGDRKQKEEPLLLKASLTLRRPLLIQDPVPALALDGLPLLQRHLFAALCESVEERGGIRRGAVVRGSGEEEKGEGGRRPSAEADAELSPFLGSCESILSPLLTPTQVHGALIRVVHIWRLR
jgi:hypothetical protein